VDERIAIQAPEPTPPPLTGIVAAPIVRLLAPSPINRRRWQNFKTNRRGYWSLWIFLFFFVISLFAEFIASDKPLYISYAGKSYFPVVFTYPETTFGGDFETAADYRDPFLQKLIAEKNGTIIWPPVRYSYDTHNLDLPTPAPSPPTWLLTEAQCKSVVERKGLKNCGDLEYNWLGTDDEGRDVLARLIYGFRVSVLFGLILTIVSSIIGVAAGAVQGYFGGWTDLLFQRFIEIWTSVPELYLLLIISSVLVPGFFVLLGIMAQFVSRAYVVPILGILVALVLARFVAVRATRWSIRDVQPADTELLFLMMPRGLITAVLALQVLASRGQIVFFLPAMAFTVVLFTNIFVVVAAVTAKTATVDAAPAESVVAVSSGQTAEPETLT